MPNWRAARDHYRAGGVDRVFEVLCAHGFVPSWIAHYYKIGVFRLRALNPNALKRRATGYEFGVATKQDAAELAATSVGAESRAIKRFFEVFFDHGNRCFVVRKDGAIVGYNWVCHSIYTVSNDNYQHRQFHLLLQSDEAVFGNGFIHPDHRMKGLFPELVRFAVDSYSSEVSFYTTIARLNDLSVKSHERLGFELLFNLACHRVGTLPYFWTVQGPDGPRRWIAWNRPTARFGELLAGPEREYREVA